MPIKNSISQRKIVFHRNQKASGFKEIPSRFLKVERKNIITRILCLKNNNGRKMFHLIKSEVELLKGKDIYYEKMSFF